MEIRDKGKANGAKRVLRWLIATLALFIAFGFVRLAIFGFVSIRERVMVRTRVAAATSELRTISGTIDHDRPGFLGYVPRDPFTENEHLYFASINRGILWSVGPDRKDGGGWIQYDPSNGTLSLGDVIQGCDSLKELSPELLGGYFMLAEE